MPIVIGDLPARPTHALARHLLKNFVTYNPMFLFSAMFVLGGAMLLNPPSSSGGRDLGLLLQLFLAIQVYELCLLGAAAILHRRGDLRRDVRNLSLVLSPFLVDVTFTTAALIAGVGQDFGYAPAFGLIAGVLALSAFKLRCVSRLTGKRFDAPTWVGLLAGPVLVAVYPFLVGMLAFGGVRGDWLWLSGGVALAAIGVLFAWLSERAPETAARDGEAPLDRWQVRCLSAVPLAVGAYHVLGTGYSWSTIEFDPSTYLLILGPVLIAGGWIVPRLVWPHWVLRDRITPLVLPAAGALCLGLADGEALGLSTWNLGLAGVAALHALLLRRDGALRYAGGLLLALHMTLGGTTVADSFAAFGSNPLEPVALLALVAYGIYRKVPEQALVVPVALAAFLVAHLDLVGSELDAVLAIDTAALCLLAWTHRIHGCDPKGVSYRYVGSLMLWLPAGLVAINAANAGHVAQTAKVFAGAAILGLLIAGVLLRERTYALPSLLIPGKLAHKLAPASASGWGTLVIGLAFAAISGGVLIALRRERLLAWLEALGLEDAEEEGCGPEQPPVDVELELAA